MGKKPCWAANQPPKAPAALLAHGHVVRAWCVDGEASQPRLGDDVLCQRQEEKQRARVRTTWQTVVYEENDAFIRILFI